MAQVGELGLLEILTRFCPHTGNDGAVISLGDSGVITTDSLVAGVHFSPATTPPPAVGWRGVAANLSDLAAMGAVPLGITVALGLPGDTPVAWVEGVYGGIRDCLRAYGGELWGGDLVRSPHPFLTITALGHLSPRGPLRRDTAQPGQVLLATGAHGLARAGLELLLHPEVGTGLTPDLQAAYIAAHQRPHPRFDVLAQLEDLLGDDGAPWPVAAMDSSDGLANGVLHLCRASGVGARVVADQLPVPAALVAWAGPERSRDWALYGGEDFELVLALEPELALGLAIALGPAATLFGTLEADPAVLLVETAADPTGIPLTWEGGFQHFA